MPAPVRLETHRGTTTFRPDHERTSVTEHGIITRRYPGSEWEPWQTTYECVCGIELGFNEQGLGYFDPVEALDAHIQEEENNDD